MEIGTIVYITLYETAMYGFKDEGLWVVVLKK